MPTYRYPILIWEDFAGHFTARLVEDLEAPAGFSAARADAVFQLKDYLNWSLQNRSWLPEPDFHQAALVNIRVEVRPEYQANDRIYPCEETILLRVPCVHGSNSGGLLICSLPTMGLKFFYQESGRLKHLVNHYSQERLRGKPPHEISRFLQPRSVALDEIVIQSNRKQSSSRYSPEMGILKTVAEPLGDKKQRRQISRAWERDLEVADLRTRIGQERANVIISGESGSGKTSVLIEAVRLVEGQADEQTESDHIRHRYWMTSGARMIAGMQYLGQWQERCERVIEELSDINGVLCVDNLLDLVRAGTESVADSLAMFLLPYLQRGELRMVAEATPTELDACRRLLPGLVDLFQILPLHPFTREQAVRALNRVATTHARNRKIPIGADLAGLTYRLFHRFQPYRAFPGKSVVFLSELFEQATRNKRSEIAINHAIAHFVEQTGLPEIFLRDEVPLAYPDVLETFRKYVIGQDAACEAAARLVTTFKAGLNDPARPLGVLLFCGPTGVGKTELARSIARYFFGGGKQPQEESRLVRLDMSEYSGWNGAQRLLSGSDGEPSDLIKRMRQQPFCVVLFDEIEKADADVFDVLLSVFDEGRLTDRYGRVTTFRSAVIIMTSNLGTDKLAATGFEARGIPSYVREAMSFFRPEFFNRIDAVVQFNSLTKEMMCQITAKELSEISRREGFVRNDLRLAWNDELIEYLVSTGFDQRYGARPLQRAIERLVVAPLARYLLEYPELKGTSLSLTITSGSGRSLPSLKIRLQ
jgi:ATP-dependent Clp protease ATP-binding subunit ClpC